MTRLIGICGQGPKSGKSEAAKILRKLLPLGPLPPFDDISDWTIKSFAEGPKFIASRLIGFNIHTQKDKDLIVQGWDTKQGIPRTVRELVIDIAEGLRDRVSDNIWINWLFKTWEEEDYNWIIDDVRFLPEVRKIKSEGGILIKIINKNAEKGEIEIPDQYIKYKVNNNGSLEELENQLREILKSEGLI